MLDPAGALWWPERQLLAVADLHLEKGSPARCAATWCRPGTPAPRWTGWRCCCAATPRDGAGAGRQFPRHAAARPADGGRRGPAARDGERARVRLAAGQPRPAAARGHARRHRGVVGGGRRRVPPPGRRCTAEVCGHHHPKASVATRAQTITRPCFVAGPQRLMLPAFGAFTGGLDVRHPAIARLFPRGARAFLLGQRPVVRVHPGAGSRDGRRLTRGNIAGVDRTPHMVGDGQGRS